MSSFKDAGLKYIWDEDGELQNRVSWVHPHNILTSNPKAALSLMSFFAKNATWMKIQAGIPLTGRKATRGNVYSFSLSWHSEQTPDKQEILGAASETLETLGLQDYQAIIVVYKKVNSFGSIYCNH